MTTMQVNFDPNIWGPGTWTFLHTVTFAYPDHPSEDEQDQMHTLIFSIANHLPCMSCKQHFKQLLQSSSLQLTARGKFLKSKSALSRWMVDVHNSVNKRLGKPTLSYNAVATIYLQQNKCKHDSKCNAEVAHANLQRSKGSISYGTLMVAAAAGAIVYAVLTSRCCVKKKPK